MTELPLKGWPNDVIEDLVACAARLITDKSITGFYIGRTNDLNATTRRHSTDNVLALYETDSVNNAIEIENNLIKVFFEHHKCKNENDHAGGGASDAYVNYVYLARW